MPAHAPLTSPVSDVVDEIDLAVLGLLDEVAHHGALLLPRGDHLTGDDVDRGKPVDNGAEWSVRRREHVEQGDKRGCRVECGHEAGDHEATLWIHRKRDDRVRGGTHDLRARCRGEHD